MQPKPRRKAESKRPVAQDAKGADSRRGVQAPSSSPADQAIPEMTAVQEAIAGHVEATLKLLGENTRREGLIRTPYRHAKAMQFLTSGYSASVEKIVGSALFEAESQEMVIVRDIELFSLCEHHLLPFSGRAHVAYIPNQRIIGLSKIPRIIDVFARRLQVQERLTGQVADELMRVLKPQGVAVIIEASHLCMMMRGVEKQNSFTITSAMRGVFDQDPTTRKELMHLLNGLNRTRG